MLNISTTATTGDSGSATGAPAEFTCYIPRHYLDREVAYTAAKKSWLIDNPACTAEQLELAFRAFAKILGL